MELVEGGYIQALKVGRGCKSNVGWEDAKGFATRHIIGMI